MLMDEPIGSSYKFRPAPSALVLGMLGAWGGPYSDRPRTPRKDRDRMTTREKQALNRKQRDKRKATR